MEPTNIAQQFIASYYGALQEPDRRSLIYFYREDSAVGWDGGNNQLMGVTSIARFFTQDFTYPTIKVTIATTDMVSGPDPSMMILVTGTVKTSPEDNRSYPFAHSFQLAPDGVTFYVRKEVFRINRS